MRPSEILDAQGDLVDRLDDTGVQHYFNIVYSMDESGRLTANESDNEAARWRALHENKMVASTLQRHVRAAYAYRVTADMSSLIQHGAALLDEEDVLDTSLAPTQAGFVGFETPLPVHDVRGAVMLIHWLTWGPAITQTGETGMAVWMFNDLIREPDEIALSDGADYDRMRELCGRWAPIATSPVINGRSVGPAEVVFEPDKYPDLVPSTNPIRYVHALWLLLNQTVTATREEDLDRASRRRAERRKLHPTVTVIALRREDTSTRNPDGEHVDRDFKWLVRGHWRWQACGPGYPGAVELDGKGWRSRIWINGYVKGDPEAPLRVTEKVYDLRR